MKVKNSVFIATSLDGYISDENGAVDWLHSIPNPDNNDMGYGEFMSNIDALVMGRTTFETVCNFDIDWPYDKPVFVLSHSLKAIPSDYEGRAFLMSGLLREILDQIHALGHSRMYIDGGKTIQSFLNEDLIDEMIITTIPIILGGGTPLFSDLSRRLEFECIHSVMYLDKVVQNHYTRQRVN